MWEYVVRVSEGRRSKAGGRDGRGAPPKTNAVSVSPDDHHPTTASDTLSSLPPIDRTPKLFIAGKQARPDQGYTRRILSPTGSLLGEVGEGNRKDLRNAVEAAHAAAKTWAKSTGHNRAQILYYLAENLSVRADEFAHRIDAMTGTRNGDEEVEAAISRLFTYAAWADKYDGAVHNVPIRGIAIAMNEPIGVVGAAAPNDHPLLGLVSLVGPLLATANTTVVLPSESYPLSATDFYSVLETSDVPAGVVNIVTGAKDALAKVLAEHDDVEAMWYFGTREGAKAVELASASNMKRTWAEWEPRDWFDVAEGEGREFLREATQVKNVWVPYGE